MDTVLSYFAHIAVALKYNFFYHPGHKKYYVLPQVVLPRSHRQYTERYTDTDTVVATSKYVVVVVVVVVAATSSSTTVVPASTRTHVRTCTARSTLSTSTVLHHKLVTVKLP